jgi:hypothetical protein
LALGVYLHQVSAATPTPTVTTATAAKQNPSPNYLIQVGGTNFTPASFITIDKRSVTTTYISPTSLQSLTPLDRGTTSIAIGVTTPYASAVSNTITVPITDAFSIAVAGENTVRLLASATYAISIIGSPSSDAVTWAVNGIVGGNTTVGTISAAGVYKTPATIPAGGTVTITATSVAAPDVSGSLTITLQNPLIRAYERTATKVGDTLTYLTDLQGTGFIPGSTIAYNGVAQATNYISPDEIQADVTVPAGTTALTVTVNQPDPGGFTMTYTMGISQAVSVSVSGSATPRLGTSNTYKATVVGSTNTGVTWQVNGVTGGTAETGTITSAGVYTAPAIAPTVPVSITAVSSAASLCSGTLALALQNPVPDISSGSATQLAGATTFPIDIRGTGFVATSVISANGSPVSTTYVAPTELQAQVTVASNADSVQITVANPAPGAAVSGAFTLSFTKVLATAAAAARLLDQSSFGPTLTSIGHVQQVGLSAYLNEQLAAAPTLLNSIPSPPPVTPLGYNYTESDLWRVSITGADQLRQRVAFALSEIFVVSMPTVAGGQVASYYNALLKDAFGNFSTVMKDMTLSQAMGNYLDMNNSSVAAPGEIANENFAREMMQLFTIGTYVLNQDGTQKLSEAGQPIPTYTESQVQAFARAYTGWKINNPTDPTVPMSPNEPAHDLTAKQLLDGGTLPAGQTAEEDLDGALSNLFTHPNVGPFVCRQLIQHLVTSAPTPAYVSRVASVFADDGSGVRGNLKAVITAILMDPEARAGDTGSAIDGGHAREPILLMANFARAFNLAMTAPNDYISLSQESATFGESPLKSPSVFGFFRPEYVIPRTELNAPEFGLENTASVLLRMNALNLMIRNQLAGVSFDPTPFGSLAAYPPDVVDTLGTLLMHAQMPEDMRTILLNTITPITDNDARARAAIYLVLNSPQYLVLH